VNIILNYLLKIWPFGWRLLAAILLFHVTCVVWICCLGNAAGIRACIALPVSGSKKGAEEGWGKNVMKGEREWGPMLNAASSKQEAQA